MMILLGGGSETGAHQPKWEIVHALEGIGLRETVHEASGWDDVTVSAQQEFAAACDAAGMASEGPLVCSSALAGSFLPRTG
jgi:hypothetical protein